MEKDRNRLFKLLKSSNPRQTTRNDSSKLESPAVNKVQRSVLSKKLLEERQNERRQQRDKLITQNRTGMTTPSITTKTTTTQSSTSNKTSNNLQYDFKTSILNSFPTKGIKNTSSNISNNIPKPKTRTQSTTEQDSSLLGATFTIDQSNLSNLSNLGTVASNNRKKLLEEWRLKKKQEDLKKNNSKPAFKAGASDSKLLNNSRSTVPTSSSFNFHLSMSSSINNSATTGFKSVKSNLPARSNSVRVTSSTPRVGSATSQPKPKPPVSAITSARPPVSKAPLTTKKSDVQKKPLNKTNDFNKELDLITKKIDTSIKLSSTRNESINELKLKKKLNPNVTLDRNNSKLDNDRQNITIQLNNEVKYFEEMINLPTSSLNETRIDTVYPNHTSSPIRRPVLEPEQIEPKQQQPELVKEQVNELILTSEYFEQTELSKRDVKYYRQLVEFNTKKLDSLSSAWIGLCSTGHVPDDIQGDIRSACGLAKLLIDERFAQFSDLIDQCENGTNCGLVVKCLDLQGFWDMVDVQVQDVEKKFSLLEKIKANNYIKTPDMIEVPAHISQPVKSVFKPNRNYLRKKDQKQSEDNKDENNKEEEEVQKAPVTKPVKTNKFAEFRAKMKAQKASNSNNGDDFEIQIQEPKSVTTPKVEKNQSNLQDSIKKSARRKSKSVVIDAPPINDSKKYNLRSRPSDLIRFDSPVKVKSRPSDLIKFDSPALLKNNLENISEDGVSNSPYLFSVRKSRKKSIFPQKINEDEELNVDDKENEEFLNFDDCPLLTWKSRPSVMPVNLTTPSKVGLTPAKQNSRESLDVPKFSNIANSPLLKIALISSQSKRLSVNSLNRLLE